MRCLKNNYIGLDDGFELLCFFSLIPSFATNDATGESFCNHPRVQVNKLNKIFERICILEFALVFGFSICFENSR
jgi:hypothetical protein